MNKNVIAKLARFINAGKNATVLTQVAKAMQNDKPLPEWANDFTKDTFVKIFSMPESKLFPILKSDSWSDYRKVINAYKGEKMDAKLVESAKALLLIPTFATSQSLKLAANWVESKEPTIADIQSPVNPSDTDTAAAATDDTQSEVTTTASASINEVLALFNQLSVIDQAILLDTLNAQSINTQKAA